MMTSCRIGIAAGRIAELINKRLNIITPVSTFFLFETGGQATFSGEGYHYNDFKRDGEILDFTGKGSDPQRIFQRTFDVALCRTVNFAETYHKMSYDCRQSNLISLI